LRRWEYSNLKEYVRFKGSCIHRIASNLSQGQFFLYPVFFALQDPLDQGDSLLGTTACQTLRQKFRYSQSFFQVQLSFHHQNHSSTFSSILE
jgi:hypothetical protein